MVDYGGLAMVSGTEEQLSGLEIRRDLSDATEIHVNGMEFDTRSGMPDDLVPDGYHTDYHIVQFIGPIKTEWKEQVLSLGGEFHNYIPNFAFIVDLENSDADAVLQLPFVRWTGPYIPAFKIHPDLATGSYSGAIALNIVLFAGEPLAPVIEHVTGLGMTVLEWDSVINPIVVARGTPEQAAWITSMDSVMWIDPKPELTLFSIPLDQAGWIIQTNVQGSKTLYDNGIHGENETIGNADTGIYVQHWAFHDSQNSVQYSSPGSGANPDTNHRKIVNYWTFGDNQDDATFSYHGTHTAGINAGDNVPNGGNGQYNGMAYKAKVSFEDVWNGWNVAHPADMNNLYLEVWNDGARVHSGSLACPAGGDYSTGSMQFDQFHWNHKDFIGVVANHNYGPSANTVCDLASAKDVISMGAGENAPNHEQMKGYSGRGPTDDNRLKPTIVTPTDVQSPNGGTTNGYGSFGGTSSSTPVAAGGVVLIRQYFRDGFYPSGTKSPTDGFNATGALMKAITVNSADEMTDSSARSHTYNNMPFPSNDQGWGRMTLDEALYFQGDTRKLFVDDDTTGLSTGGSKTYDVNIVNSNEPLEVTLAWLDYWGQPNTSPEIVNDLDLQLTAPDGTTIYKGNVFPTGSSSPPHESTTGGNFDSVNVVENILRLTPQTGGWKVKVSASNTPQGPQPFALVITGNFSIDPDLAVTENDLTMNATDLDEGDPVTFNATAWNLGGVDQLGVTVEVLFDGSVVDTKILDFDVTFRNITHQWTAEWGPHSFGIRIDPNDLVDELNENNNEAVINFYVNKLPVPVLDVTPTETYTLNPVTANASASSDDGTVTKFMFDWGDGKKTNWLVNPVSSHAYLDDGVYNISLKVMDNNSIEVEIDSPIQVTILNRMPHVNMTFTSYQTHTYTDIAFDGTRSSDMDGEITMEWDFGDGIITNETMPLHNWSDDGSYRVTLTVTDDDGAENSTSVDITVLNRLPTCSFQVPQLDGNVTTPFEFTPFYNDMDGEVVAFHWEFGDGNTSTDEIPVHHYGDDGFYTVSLRVEDDDGDFSSYYNITITIFNLAPIANISAESLEFYTLEEIKFESTSVDLDGRILNYTWNMNDGHFYQSESVTHSYSENKVYTITLKVVDDDGAYAQVNLSVRVLNRAPDLVVMYNRTVIEGQLVNMSAINSSDPDGFLIEIVWELNETTTKLGERIQYAYWTPGNYTFKVTAKDNDGATTTMEYNITVLQKPAKPPPITVQGLGDALMWILLAIILIVIAIAVVVGMTIYRKRQGQKPPSAPPPPLQPQAPPEEPRREPIPDFDPDQVAYEPMDSGGNLDQGIQYDEFGLPVQQEPYQPQTGPEPPGEGQ
jgi:PKD repeat protein